MKKKQVPITIINQVHAALKNASHLIGVSYPENCVVVLKEKGDPDSPFYFKVESIELRTENRTVYALNYLPSNNENLQPTTIDVIASDLIKHLETWVARVVQFNQESDIFDDKILQAYYDEIGPKFKITDPDADYAPIKHEEQGVVNSYYDAIADIIESKKNPSNATEAKEIIEEIEEAKNIISKETKNQAFDRFRKICAKVMRYSFEAGKALMTEVIIEIGKRFLIGG